jgi:hypothetical protein
MSFYHKNYTGFALMHIVCIFNQRKVFSQTPVGSNYDPQNQTIMIKSIIALFLFCISFAGQSQGTSENITKEFFKQYEVDPTAAYINVFKGNKWMTDKKSALETTKIKLADLIGQLGKYEGYEFITEKKAGDSFVFKSFLVKYERQPLRFTFLLYKPNKDWQIQNFSFDDGMDVELEEAAKFNRLKENW